MLKFYFGIRGRNSYLFLRTPAQVCENCDSQFTLVHLFRDCPFHSALRRRFNFLGTLPQLLRDHEPTIRSQLTFLNSSTCSLKCNPSSTLTKKKMHTKIKISFQEKKNNSLHHRKN